MWEDVHTSCVIIKLLVSLSRAPGLSPSGGPWATWGAAASPKGHYQQTPEPQLCGHPQYSWNRHRHGQRWAVMTSSPAHTHPHTYLTAILQNIPATPPIFFWSVFCLCLSTPPPPLSFDGFLSWTFAITLSHCLKKFFPWEGFWGGFFQLQSNAALQ